MMSHESSYNHTVKPSCHGDHRDAETRTRSRIHGPADREALLPCMGVLFALALLISVLHPSSAWADTVFASGSGSETDPYIIETVAQLEAFRDAVNTGNTYEGNTIQLAADMDISASAWTPIGSGSRAGSGMTTASTPFKGTFDGAQHVVSGLTITTTGNPDQALGFFGVLDGGRIKNLNLDNVSIQVPTSKLAGGVVGLAINNVTISGIRVSGTVSGDAGIGGVVGRMTVSGTITDCTNSATVSASGTGNCGGIVGAAYYTALSGQMVIADCTNTAPISGTEAVGGIVGLGSAFVSNCSNSGAITGSSYSIGGIVGEQKNYGAVNGCHNEGAITNTSTDGYGTGGIVGWARYDGAATAYPASSPISITDNANTGSIKGGNDGGGIVGCMYNAGTVTGNTNEAPSISGTTFAGGIVGDLQNPAIKILPISVPIGIAVENNVSTTPLGNIAASDKDAYAYNNDPAHITVADNSGAWVAETDEARFATLPRALAMTSQGGTVTLIADVTDEGTVTKSGTATTTLDLNGHSVRFDEDPAFQVDGGTLILVDTGKVLTDGRDLSDLIATSASTGRASESGTLSLEGGSYLQDVYPYVADGYAEFVSHEAADDARYRVLPADQARVGAVAAVTIDGKTEYFENIEDAKAAAAALPGSELAIFDSAPQDPDHGNAGEATDPTVDGASVQDPQQQPSPGADRVSQELGETANTESSSLVNAGDIPWVWPFGFLIGIIFAFGGTFFLIERRSE